MARHVLSSYDIQPAMARAATRHGEGCNYNGSQDYNLQGFPGKEQEKREL